MSKSVGCWCKDPSSYFHCASRFNTHELAHLLLNPEFLLRKARSIPQCAVSHESLSCIHLAPRSSVASLLAPRSPSLLARLARSILQPWTPRNFATSTRLGCAGCVQSATSQPCNQHHTLATKLPKLLVARSKVSQPSTHLTRSPSHFCQ